VQTTTRRSFGGLIAGYAEGRLDLEAAPAPAEASAG
jgi:hypothetical protein